MPEGQSKSRGAQFSGSTLAELPDIRGGEHVISIIRDLGYALHGEPLSNQEVLAWSQLTGVKLDSWTASIITTLSGDYMSQRQESRKPEAPAPYLKELKGDDLREAGRNFSDKFKAIAKRSTK